MCTPEAKQEVDKHLVLLIEAVDRVVNEVVGSHEGICEPTRHGLMEDFGEVRGQLMIMRSSLGVVSPLDNLFEALDMLIDAGAGENK